MIAHLPTLRVDAAQAAKAAFALPAVQAEIQAIKERHKERIAEQVALSEIPAPPFHEEVRAAEFAKRMRAYGAQNVHTEEPGIVIGEFPGTDPEGPVLVVAAHLDTVFPEGTDVRVTDKNGVKHGPGISDDADGLASLLQIVRAMGHSQIRTIGKLMVVATVGEEGNGDIRGSKALTNGPHHFDGFIAIDSADVHRVLRGSVGSRRFRFVFSSLGGHSFKKFGLIASANHALCRAATKIADLQVPTDPITTFTVGTIKGGTSVNAISAHAEMEVDMRSSNMPELVKLQNKVLAVVDAAVAEENARWGVSGEAAVSVEKIQIGDRPTGESKDDSCVIHSVRAAMGELGIELKNYALASTDQNAPLSKGIPATTIGGGGTEANNHSLSEWWDPKDAWQSPQMAFLSILTLLGVDGVSKPILDKLPQ